MDAGDAKANHLKPQARGEAWKQYVYSKFFFKVIHSARKYTDGNISFFSFRILLQSLNNISALQDTKQRFCHHSIFGSYITDVSQFSDFQMA